jgi:hypothetical protein
MCMKITETTKITKSYPKGSFFVSSVDFVTLVMKPWVVSVSHT